MAFLFILIIFFSFFFSSLHSFTLSFFCIFFHFMGSLVNIFIHFVISCFRTVLFSKIASRICHRKCNSSHLANGIAKVLKRSEKLLRTFFSNIRWRSTFTVDKDGTDSKVHSEGWTDFSRQIQHSSESYTKSSLKKKLCINSEKSTRCSAVFDWSFVYHHLSRPFFTLIRLECVSTHTQWEIAEVAIYRIEKSELVCTHSMTHI